MLEPKVVARLKVEVELKQHVRATPTAHSHTPLGMGYGRSRFSCPNDVFKLLYLAPTLSTAVAETIVRDRFVWRDQRVLAEDELLTWSAALVETTQSLTLIDLRTTGALLLGVPTNAVRGQAQEDGRRLSAVLYRQFPELDGILYASRLTGETCVAVYDRATRRLRALEVRSLALVPGLHQALNDLNIALVPSRASTP